MKMVGCIQETLGYGCLKVALRLLIGEILQSLHFIGLDSETAYIQKETLWRTGACQF